MQEFSSVTASSYDADSLAPLLNSKAADGWSVVSIVAAGTNIVAYLQREADDAATPHETVDTTLDSGDELATSEPTYGDTPTLGDTPSDETPADEAPVEEAAPGASPIGSPFIPAATAGVAETTPVDEPAGWASAPEQAIETPVLAADTADTSIADLAAQVSEPEPVAAAAPVAAAVEPVAAVVEPDVAEVAPAPESTVPAGWYADPSGRFELRYWDGAAWTEHVSRAGQQFTDPPVA